LVKWDNGAEIWVNRGESDWQVGEHLLPQYGFWAEVPVEGGILEAGIVHRSGAIVEWSRGLEMVYANARPVVIQRNSQSGRLAEGPDLRPTRMNPAGEVISFGAISTNGAARLTREGERLVVTPLPDGPYFVLSIDWADLPWTMVEPNRLEAVDEDDRVLWSVPVSIQDGQIEFTCEPGVFAYRFR